MLYLIVSFYILSFIECSHECGQRGCYEKLNERGDNIEECCHPECLGGCTGPKNTECYACKNVYDEGKCSSGCHPTRYKVGYHYQPHFS